MAPLSTPDAVLSRRLRARDHSAWEELYVAHGAHLRAFALRLARDPHEADDLVQETFVRALPRLDRMDPDEVALRPYLFTTLRNTFLKSCERRRRVAPVEEVPEPDAPAAIEDDPERSLLLNGQIAEVRAANAALAPRQRLALALRELEGCSYAEIGVMVGLKENAVAQLISRARESLRSALRLAQIDAADLPDACRRLLPQLSRHLDGQLRGEQLDATLAHLEGCEHCQDALDSMREASRRYRGFMPPPFVTEDAHAAAIDAALTATGFWESTPSRWSRATSRRLALLAAAALVLAGGGTLVAASGTVRPDRPATPPPLSAAAARALPPGAASAPLPPAPPLSSRKTAPRAPTTAQGHQGQSVPTGSRARARARRPVSRPRPLARTHSAGTSDRTRARARTRTGTGTSTRTRKRAGTRTPIPAHGHDAPTARPGDPVGGSTDEPPGAPTQDEARPQTTAPEPDPDRTPDAAPPPARIPSGSAAGDAAGTGASDRPPPRPVEALPDLVVTALTETGFTVVNAGAAAAGPFVVSVTLAGSYTFAGLPAGAAATRTWRCQRGTLSAVADGGNTVAESDETNNRRLLVSRC